MREAPNIAVVVMDTARDRDVTATTAPTISTLGDAGTRFTRAFSAAPWTLPSHGSLFTGLYPSKHGAYSGHEYLGDAHPTLPELLGEAGYETVGITNNTWVTPESGFDGFDTLRKAWQLLPGEGNMLWEMVQVQDEESAQGVFRRALSGNPVRNLINAAYAKYLYGRRDSGAERTTGWIDDWLAGRSDDRPFFLFANYIEPHLEYDPPREYAEQFLDDEVSYYEAAALEQDPWEYLVGNVNHAREEFAILRDLYQAEIAHLDAQIDRLREALIDAGEWDDTILVVVGDHGENLGDHGMMDHQYCLYDTLLHVPLVVHGPGFEDGGEVDDLVSLVDLAPTLLDAAGAEAPAAREEFQGRSLHPDTGAEPPEQVYAEYLHPQPTMDALKRQVGELPEYVYRFDRSLRAVRTPEYKFVRGSDGNRELYHVAEDSAERSSLVNERPDIAADLEERLDSWLDSFEHAETSDEVEISGARRDQLEELGYLQ
ncbi:Arylsulfatase A [Natronoarchaeum philippinense]|uniref:Arylsulfatase A n=1 Tax=Natronoarchaeum philippinense TaxID=558529 RepID=A0A285N5Z3_NATPI|nr:sulfatase [Natronoarchaeum philippinense]SNZ04829.1 Arylsulfatase A [Natronoarchaeum philippinense]